ncbi:Cu+-exporting ATPase [Rhizobium sp. NFR07]|uniref:heavy metal translocating P-type ATPase n=1 Tax=Rhizobium sp. NFR07 TaxID=1566262 RepID=UPI0008EC433C|nr:heavy metal translocating P-type ATPase [Rhizobium sp. NFR07]SFB03141.1 Cu+-exporting ATPase [Rhizobium sp. NFR07]
MNQHISPSGSSRAPEPLTIPVEGMHCASCVRRVETGAAKLAGVISSAVNFATKKLTVETGEGFDPDALDKAIRKLGYEIPAGAMDHALREAGMVVSGASNADVSDQQDRRGSSISPTRGESRGRAPHPAHNSGDHDHASHPTHDHAHMHHGEEASLKRDLAIAFILTLPLFVLEMAGHAYAPFHHWLMGVIDTQNLYYLYFVLATAVIFWPGLRFFRIGLPALLRGAPEMNSLVAVGVAAAYGYSVVTTFAPGLLPEAARYVYYEAATVIVTLILFGRLMEARATGRTGAAIEKLAGLQAKTARIERNGREIDVPTAEVVPGDTVIIRPGERIPVDGTVIDGQSNIDESMISGEPIPVSKTMGATVIGGTINTTGTLRFTATKVGRDTMLAGIIRMVEQAQGAKLPIQTLVDRVTAWFVPAVIALAIVTFAVWYIVGPEPKLTHALISAVAVLIIACPCAMGLAVPVSIVVGGGRAAELGVLFRKGAALQGLADVSTVVVDKTGTVTKGRPELTDFITAEGFDETETLALVAAVEARSEHPIADAIVRSAEARGLAVAKAEEFESATGYGIRAKVGTREVAVGADRYMEKLGLPVDIFADAASRLGDEGKTPLYAAIDGKLAAIIAVADPLKASSVEAIRALKSIGIEVVMVTGDNRRTADAIARQVGIDKVVAEVLPEGKVEAIHELRGHDRKLAFVGDGINDAPALAEADIGIAIGTGTDVAIESADVVLVGGELSGMVSAIAVSRATMANIRQNLFWAFGYNVALIPVAAGVLYPVFGITLSPMIGAGAMALSSVFVLGNALRLKTFRAEETR